MLCRSQNTPEEVTVPLFTQLHRTFLIVPKAVFSVSRKCMLALAMLALLLLPARPASAWSVTLGWNAVTNAPVSGYRVYCGTASQTYTTTYDAGNSTQMTVSGLSNGVTYYFAMKSYNGA